MKSAGVELLSHPSQALHVRMAQIPLASYMLQRLHQYGVHHLHGVPGDFSLPFLKHVKNSPVKWVGNCNELNAGYAADGYARMKGLGALCTTYGVGELSAINAIAGSYAERVPVLEIVGIPHRAAQEQLDKRKGRDGKGLLHHMLNRRRPIDQYQWMHKEVTVAQYTLSVEGNSASAFDSAIRQALLKKGPVHVSLPSDMADTMVNSDRLQNPIPQDRKQDPQQVNEVAQAIYQGLTSSKRPLIMVDGVSERYDLRQEINQLVSRTVIPTVCLQHGLGIVENAIPNFYGVYTGSLASPELKQYVDSSDFVLLFCPLLSDTGTASWSAVPPDRSTIWIEGDNVSFPFRHYQVHAKQLLPTLLQYFDPVGLRLRKDPSLPKQYQPASAAVIPPRESPITQDYLWPRLSSFFQSGDTILLANGTPLIGSKLFDLPAKVRVIASGLWYSVGSMLPAAQGAALAMKDRDRGPDWSGRTILLEGDGSFQATAQELSTIIRYELDCTIFIANNEGYAYERLIEGLKDDYNDVAAWKYTLAPSMMGGESTAEYPIRSFTATTVGEMEFILEDTDVRTGKGLTLVDMKMGREDVPEYFNDALGMAGKRLAGL